MDPITIAMGLANFAPQIIKWITGSDKAADAANTVVSIAQQVTGRADGSAALEALKADPNMALQFRQAVLTQEADLDKAYLADVQSARDRDTVFVKSGAHNYRADTMFVLAVVVICALVYLVWKDTSITEFVKGIFTLVLGRFLGYLDNIYNFEFGTTRGSQNKDATISKLSDR
jgi:hypothetical protein